MSAKVVAFVLAVSAPLLSHAPQTSTVNKAESSIRRVATKKPMPLYPAESVAKKSTGVAVAAIASGVDGRVASVTVLEAPDDAIAAAIRDALLNWEIPPTSVMGRSEQYGVRGKITFYFQITNGRSRVANAEDLPGGPKPEPASGPPTSPPGTRTGASPPGTRTGAPPPVVIGGHVVAADLEIDETALTRMQAALPRPTLLDIRERTDFKRAHRNGALNIPRDELAVRSWIELDRTRPVVIDCSRAATSECQQAAQFLIRGPKPSRVLIFVP